MKFEAQADMYIVTFDDRFVKGYVSEKIPVEISETIETSVKNSMQKVSKESQVCDFLYFTENPGKINFTYITVAHIDSIQLKLQTFSPLLVGLDAERDAICKRVAKKILEFDVLYIASLIGEEFTIDQLHDVYSAFVDADYDKGNFHKLVSNLDILEDTGKKLQNVSYRPPKLYRFRS